MPPILPALVLAAMLTLLPFLAAGFFRDAFANAITKLPRVARLVAPALLCVPYLIVSLSTHTLRLPWLALYTILPVAVGLLLNHASRIDTDQHGSWPDLLVLATLGLAVDLRWFENAWPPHLAVFNKMLLLDTGIWGFFAIRELRCVGFDLRPHWLDLRISIREFLLYTPIAITLGLTLGFLHVHALLPGAGHAAASFAGTFLFIAVPEELFFRGWVQNLLERRTGRTPALFLTAALFGLSHFNKRAAHFNWRYVLLAAIAGIFYGRAWRADRRVVASALTHASVDTIWSLWLR